MKQINFECLKLLKSGTFLWYIFSVAVICLCLFHVSTLFDQYISEEPSVSINPSSIPFEQPDILICLNKPFATDYIHKPPKKDFGFMNRVATKIKYFDERLTKKDRLKEYERNTDSYLWNSVNITELYQAFFYRQNDLFLTVECSTVKLKVEKLRFEMNWHYLGCWRVGTDACSMNSPLRYLRLMMYIHTHSQNLRYPGPLNISIQGIPLEFFKMRKTFDFDVTDSVILYILPKYESSHEGALKLSLIGGTSTEVRLSASRFNKANMTNRNCRIERTMYTVHDLLKFNETRNFKDPFTCRSVAFQRLYYKNRKCIVPTLPIPMEIPRNTTRCMSIFNDDFSFKNTLASIIARDQNKQNLMDQCNNEIECSSIQYFARVNHMSWPLESMMAYYVKVLLPETIKRELKTSPGLNEFVEMAANATPLELNSWRKNLYYVDIRPQEYNSTLVHESIQYGAKNLYADVGGMLGFYLGICMMTLFQISCNFFNFLRHISVFSKDKRVTSGSHDENINL